MSLVATQVAAGYLVTAFAVSVLVVYGVAAFRRCVPAVYAVHVIAAGLAVAMLVAVSAYRSTRHPGETGLAATLLVSYAVLVVGLYYVVARIRERITSSCEQERHRDYWHSAPRSG